MLAGQSNVLVAYLFGSVARGESGPQSDLDIGVLFEPPPAATLRAQPYDLAAALEQATGKSVDLVALNQAPADLVHRVLTDGILLVDKDTARRIAFETRKRAEYFDLLPILQRYRKRRVA